MKLRGGITLPVDWRLGKFQGIGVKGPKIGVLDDLISLFSKNFPSHKIANMFRYPNNMSNTLDVVTREVGRFMHVVHLLPEVELQHGADIHGVSQ